MTLYARVVSDVVVETFTPPGGLTISDCFTAAVAAQFIPVPAGPSVVPGWTYDGTTFAAPVAPTLTLAQQAMIALGAGCHIVSTGTPAINGVYPLDFASQVKTIALTTYIAANGTFPATVSEPGGASTWPRYDVNGVAHVFPNTTTFMVWATNIANYTAALDLIVDSGSGSLPAQPITMA
jgi:hypothetical protein